MYVFKHNPYITVTKNVICLHTFGVVLFKLSKSHIHVGELAELTIIVRANMNVFLGRRLSGYLGRKGSRILFVLCHPGVELKKNMKKRTKA